MSFFSSDPLYSYAESYLLSGIDNWMITIVIKMGLFFFYLIPLAIGALLIKSKFSLLQDLGLLFAGFGFGIVIKIVLIFAGVLFPYRF